MRIVVSDSSCLIDLHKVSMLELLLRLPYEFLIPNTLAAEHAIEVQGVLWVLDQLHVNRLTPTQAVLDVLRAFVEDATVRLPRRELSAYLKRYESLK